MGDRCSVTLQILSSQKDKAQALFDCGFDDEFDDNGVMHEFTFSEVNYGNLDFLEKLRDAGIAYDSNWDTGSEYGPGTASCRFTAEGECVQKEILDELLNPSLDSLLILIDEPNALREFILMHQEKVSTLDWDNQEEYGKIFQAKRLIFS